MTEQASDPPTDAQTARIAALLNAVDAPVVVLDDHGRVVQLNPACEQTMGLSVGDGLFEAEAQTALLLETSQSLQQVTRTLLQKLTTLDDVLALVCAEACRLTGAAGSAVLLLDATDRLTVRAAHGRPPPTLTQFPVQASLAGEVIAQQAPLLLNDVDSRKQAYYRTPDLRTLLAAPLRAGDETIGVLDVVNKPGGFSPEDRHIIALFADQAAVAIENARLHQRAEQLAIVEERQRLARELHDSVTQSLYTVTLYAHAAHKALSAGKEAVAADHLRELRALAREVTLEMRLLLFELHPPVLEKEGVVTAVQTRLDAVEARSGLQTEFGVTGAERRLPVAVEEALYRIAQEALTNAVKHARPQRIGVELEFAADHITLRVQDDGAGFDVEQAGQTAGLGLRSIQERVARLDGTLTLDSAPGTGTVLTVCIAA